MTATPSSEARAEARAEAERRYPAPDLPGDNIGLRVGFVEGAEWKGAQDASFREEIRRILRSYGPRAGQTTSGGYGVLDELARALSGVESSDEGEADGRHGSV
jgi:hypothetical protein